MADIQESSESLLVKAEECFLIAMLAPDKGIEAKYSRLAKRLRNRVTKISSANRAVMETQ
jgi:hypothetical protein